MSADHHSLCSVLAGFSVLSWEYILLIRNHRHTSEILKTLSIKDTFICVIKNQIVPVMSWTPNSSHHFCHTLVCAFYGSWCMAWCMAYRFGTASLPSAHLHTSCSDDKPIGTGVSPGFVHTYTYKHTWYILLTCYIFISTRQLYQTCVVRSSYQVYLTVVMYVIDTTAVDTAIIE